MTRATRSVRLNREIREGTLPPTLIAKTYHPGNVTDVSRPLIRSLSYEFQCHQRKTNTSSEANQSALSACSIRYMWLYMPQCRDPVVHKICIRKLNGYLFILKNIVSEKWSLERSLSSLIRGVIQSPSSANFFYFCC